MSFPQMPIRRSSAEKLIFEWGQINWLVAGSLRNSKRLTFGIVRIKARRANPLHRHPNCEELLHLVRGRIEHWIGRKRVIMNAGDTIVIPPNVNHKARVLGKGDATMMICFSTANRQFIAAD